MAEITRLEMGGCAHLRPRVVGLPDVTSEMGIVMKMMASTGMERRGMVAMLMSTVPRESFPKRLRNVIAPKARFLLVIYGMMIINDLAIEVLA